MYLINTAFTDPANESKKVYTEEESEEFCMVHKMFWEVSIGRESFVEISDRSQNLFSFFIHFFLCVLVLLLLIV